MARTWAKFYENVVGSRRLLEGNVMEHAPFVEEVARLVKAGDRILEVGSGTGVLASPLAKGGVEVVSLDNDPKILEMAAVNARVLGVDIKYVFGEALELPFEDGEFAVAFSEGLVEHYSDEEIERLVREHLRVAPVAVVSVPLSGRHPISFGNERWLSREEWEGKLAPFGLVRSFEYSSGPDLCMTLGGQVTPGWSS